MDFLIDSNDLFKYSIECSDGEIGKVQNFYFDEGQHYLRYFIVDTKEFLVRNLILLSPMCLTSIDPDEQKLITKLTKEELENAPPFNSEQTVSMQYEEAYHRHFALPFYWERQHVPWTIGPYGIPWEYYGEGPFTKREHVINSKKLIKDAENNDLRSAKELFSYSVQALDEKFGHVQGFLINSQSYAIEFFIIDTVKFLPSKLILIRPQWVHHISWHKKTIEVPFFEDMLKASPVYHKHYLNDEFINKVDQYFFPLVSELPEREERFYSDRHSLD